MKLSMFNARSLVNKLKELHCYLSLCKHDIVCVTETWLSSNIGDCVLVGNTDYSIYRKDRCGRHGGGVCIFVRNSSVKSFRVGLQPIYDNLELIAIDVLCCTGKFRLVVGYRPPTSSERDTADLAYTKILCDCLDSLYPPNTAFLICGDFNLPKINWFNDNHALSDVDTCSGLFLDFYFKYALKQFVDEATRLSSQKSRNGSILDVVFCNDEHFVHNTHVVEPFGSSDHCIVNFDVLSDINVEMSDVLVYDYNQADWDGIRHFLDNIDFFTLFNDSSDCADIVSKFYRVINDCIRQFVPQRNVRSRFGQAQSRYPTRIRKLLRKKSVAWRIYRRFRTNECHVRYCRISSICRAAIHSYHVQREENIINSGNVGRFFNYANRKFKCNSSVGPLRLPDGSITVDPTRKADLLQSVFSTKFTTDNGVCPSFPPRGGGGENLNFVYFSALSVKRAIRKLKSKSSGGPDQISPLLVKMCSDQLCSPLAFVYNSCMEHGYLPPMWLSANVTPVFKKGDPTDPNNYRPISLTCTLCKIMESIIKDSLLAHLLSKGLISRHQHGFISRHSTGTNLLESTHDWITALSGSKFVDIVYIDFSRAFDSIVFTKLLAKLESYGIGGRLLDWIGSFLSPRVQRVVVENCYSYVSKVVSGVPQGSVLGVILFLIFINDVSDLCDDNTRLKLFADDLKLYTTFDRFSDPNHLQHTLDKLVSWSADWQLGINFSKCSSMSIQRNRSSQLQPHRVYVIDGHPIPSVSSVSDLGITVEAHLNYSSHISSCISKARRRVGTFFRGFSSHNLVLARKAWLTYIRPLLEYNSCIWNPTSVYLTDRIEQVQRQFTKRLRSISHLTYLERLALLGLEPLELRRLRSDLLFYFKILNNHTVFHPNHYFSYHQPSLSNRVSSPHLVKPLGCTRTVSGSFFYRAVDCYNRLSADIRHSDTPRCFFRKLFNVDFTPFLIGSCFKTA